MGGRSNVFDRECRPHNNQKINWGAGQWFAPFYLMYRQILINIDAINSKFTLSVKQEFSLVH
jgi:hypothetical protein